MKEEHEVLLVEVFKIFPAEFLEAMCEDVEAVVELFLVGGKQIRINGLERIYQDATGAFWIHAHDRDRGSTVEVRVDQIQIATVLSTIP